MLYVLLAREFLNCGTCWRLFRENVVSCSRLTFFFFVLRAENRANYLRTSTATTSNEKREKSLIADVNEFVHIVYRATL